MEYNVFFLIFMQNWTFFSLWKFVWSERERERFWCICAGNKLHAYHYFSDYIDFCYKVHVQMSNSLHLYTNFKVYMYHHINAYLYMSYILSPAKLRWILSPFLIFSVYKQINRLVRKEGRVNYLGVGGCCKFWVEITCRWHLTLLTHGEREWSILTTKFET